MTDDPRTHEGDPAEGRVPSDLTGVTTPAPEPARPDFLPAENVPGHGAERPRDDGWSQLGGPPERLRSAGESPEGWSRAEEIGWGDPSGRSRNDTAIVAAPYGSRPNGDTAVFTAPPPPPSQASGMGPGWAPPPGPPFRGGATVTGLSGAPRPPSGAAWEPARSRPSR
nr:hypothetical protein GCM10020093_060120 [Planobispora longispora]